MSKIVTICGSSKFVDVMAVCSWLLERDEGVLVFGLHLLPMWYPGCPPDHLAEHEGVNEHMDKLHREKIALSEEIFVVNVNNYIGASTQVEINYAQNVRYLPVRWWTDDPIGEKCRELMKC